ncbi:hypothetical protein LINPERHAP1_LOCUS14559, partial [Linum perenne]
RLFSSSLSTSLKSRPPNSAPACQPTPTSSQLQFPILPLRLIRRNKDLTRFPDGVSGQSSGENSSRL